MNVCCIQKFLQSDKEANNFGIGTVSLCVQIKYKKFSELYKINAKM